MTGMVYVYLLGALALFALGIAWLWTRRSRVRSLSPRTAHELLQALEGYIFVFSPEGRLLWATPEAPAQFHILDEALGQPVTMTSVFEEYPTLANWVLRPATSRPVDTLVRVETGSGIRYWHVRLVGVPWKGNSLAKLIYLRDVTRRQEATDRLHLRLQQTRWVSRLLELTFRPEPLETSLQEALKIFLQPLENFRVRAVALYGYDEDTRSFHLLATLGLSQEHFQEYIPGARLPDMETGPQEGRFCLREPLPLASWVFPLHLGQAPQGLLWLATETPEAPTPAQREVFHQAAHLLTLMLRSKALFQDRLRLGQAFEHDVDGLLIFRLSDGQPVFGNLAVERLTGKPWTTPALSRTFLQLLGTWEDVVQQLQNGAYLERLHEHILDDGVRILRFQAFAVTVPPDEQPSYGVLTFQDLTEHEGLIRQLRRHTDFIEHLLRMSQAMLEGRMRMVDVLGRILQTTQAMVEAEGGTLILIDEQRIPYSVFAGNELFPPGAFTRRVLWEGLAGWVLEQRSGTLVVDTHQDRRWLNGGEQEWRSALGVPIFYGDTPLAVLTLTHGRPGHFTDEHLRLMEAAADIMALALYTARLYEDQYFLTQQLAAAKEESEVLQRKQVHLFRLLFRTLHPAVIQAQEEWTRLWRTLARRGERLSEDLLHLWETWREAERHLASFEGWVKEEEKAFPFDRASVSVIALVRELARLLRPWLEQRHGHLQVTHPHDLHITAHEDGLFYLLFHVVYHLGLRGSHPQIELRVQREGTSGVRFAIQHRQWVLSPEEERRWRQWVEAPGVHREMPEDLPLPPVVASLVRRLSGWMDLESEPSQGTVVRFRFPG